jgi:hypothetical protein
MKQKTPIGFFKVRCLGRTLTPREWNLIYGGLSPEFVSRLRGLAKNQPHPFPSNLSARESIRQLRLRLRKEDYHRNKKRSKILPQRIGHKPDQQYPQNRPLKSPYPLSSGGNNRQPDHGPKARAGANPSCRHGENCAYGSALSDLLWLQAMGLAQHEAGLKRLSKGNWPYTGTRD